MTKYNLVLSESTIEIYNETAQKYERRWQKYLDHTHNSLLNQLKISPRDTILDASSGTGLLLKKIIERKLPFENFFLNDPSANMLDIARERFSKHSNVHFSNKQVQQLSYPKNTFDTIISLNAFHFYHEQQRVADKFYMMLKPGGKLYILDWNRAGFFRLVNQFITWTTSEYIRTRTLTETQNMLLQSGFSLQTSQTWRWRYWKLFLLKSIK